MKSGAPPAEPRTSTSTGGVNNGGSGSKGDKVTAAASSGTFATIENSTRNVSLFHFASDPCATLSRLPLGTSNPVAAAAISMSPSAFGASLSPVTSDPAKPGSGVHVPMAKPKSGAKAAPRASQDQWCKK